MGFLHVVRDFLHHPALCSRGFEWQHLLDLLPDIVRDLEGDPGSGLCLAFFQNQAAFKPEEFVEDQN